MEPKATAHYGIKAIDHRQMIAIITTSPESKPSIFTIILEWIGIALLAAFGLVALLINPVAFLTTFTVVFLAMIFTARLK